MLDLNNHCSTKEAEVRSLLPRSREQRNIQKITRVQEQGCQVRQFIHNMESIIDFAQVNGVHAKEF